MNNLTNGTAAIGTWNITMGTSSIGAADGTPSGIVCVDSRISGVAGMRMGTGV